MLIEFKCCNYRSFQEQAHLSMKSVGLSDMKHCLLERETLPSVAIFGKNGAGKSNVIRAFWLATQFIKNAQRTQHETARVPRTPFLLDDHSREKPTSFEFTYLLDGVKYIYGYEADETTIYSEYLSHAPNGKEASIFRRNGQEFKFPSNSERKIKQLISETVGQNQLFFSVACTMNYDPCKKAMKWFREKVSFSRDFNDIPEQILEYSENENVLKSIVTYAKEADVGIHDITFESKDYEINSAEDLPKQFPDELKMALSSFMEALSAAPNEGESAIKSHEIKTTTYHTGRALNGEIKSFPLNLASESDGTKKLMAFAPAIEEALTQGGVFLVDEIEKELHPKLVEFIVAKFQSPNTNKSNAQLIFTTHSTELLHMEYLRKDQIYFTDKDPKTGGSELYNLMTLSPKTNENIRKSYLLGKYGGVPNLDIEDVDEE